MSQQLPELSGSSGIAPRTAGGIVVEKHCVVEDIEMSPIPPPPISKTTQRGDKGK